MNFTVYGVECHIRNTDILHFSYHQQDTTGTREVITCCSLLLGDSPPPEFYVLPFKNTLSVPSS